MNSIKEGAPFQIIAAPFTPMDEAGNVNLEVIKPMATFLRQIGVDGVFVGGTTGEGASLTITERLELANAWKVESDPSLKCLVHVGHACLEDACELARHAESIKADGIAAIGSCFFPITSSNVLVAYCAEIAAAAPRTPFYYYHMPSMARVQVNVSEALPQLVKSIPNFAGVKFTHEDLADYRRCLELAQGNLEIFFGRDELLLEGLKLGARSAVGSTYNFGTPLYREIIRAFDRDDLVQAEKLQKLATAAIDIMIKFGGLPAIKAAMGLSGIDCGAMRLPLEALNAERTAALKQSLEAIDYFETLEQLSYAPLSS